VLSISLYFQNAFNSAFINIINGNYSVTVLNAMKKENCKSGIVNLAKLILEDAKFNCTSTKALFPIIQ